MTETAPHFETAGEAAGFLIAMIHGDGELIDMGKSKNFIPPAMTDILFNYLSVSMPDRDETETALELIAAASDDLPSDIAYDEIVRVFLNRL